MKYGAKTTDFKRIFALCLGLTALCIILGIVISFKTTGNVLSGGVTAIRNASFEETSFFGTISKAVYIHFWYSISVMIFSTGFPGVLLPGAYIAFRAFFLGTAVGLAAKTCTLAKAASICFAVFISNVLILPLYILMFFISLSFSAKAYPGGMFSGNTAKEYFSFVAKILLVFVLICIAECVQTLLGVMVLKAMAI